MSGNSLNTGCSIPFLSAQFSNATRDVGAYDTDLRHPRSDRFALVLSLPQQHVVLLSYKLVCKPHCSYIYLLLAIVIGVTLW